MHNIYITIRVCVWMYTHRQRQRQKQRQRQRQRQSERHKLTLKHSRILSTQPNLQFRTPLLQFLHFVVRFTIQLPTWMTCITTVPLPTSLLMCALTACSWGWAAMSSHAIGRRTACAVRSAHFLGIAHSLGPRIRSRIWRHPGRHQVYVWVTSRRRGTNAVWRLGECTVYMPRQNTAEVHISARTDYKYFRNKLSHTPRRKARWTGIWVPWFSTA